jgi:hypothetical protein
MDGLDGQLEKEILDLIKITARTAELMQCNVVQDKPYTARDKLAIIIW